MKIIDYFKDERQEHWRAQIAQYEWRAAKFLAQLLAEGTFHDTLGKSTLYLLVDGETLASFLTLAERDCIEAPEYTPWIGFVHTAPEYRGRRCAGQLIDHAMGVAAQHGAQQVYICTDHVGLYEKYGFTYLENRVSIYGEDSRVYVRKPDFRIAELTEEMLPQVFDFERRLSEEEPGYYRWTEEADYQDKVRASFHDGRFANALTLVAVAGDGNIVGRIDASLIPTHFDGSMKCYLDRICVLKSWRHRGVAQALMAALRKELAGRGIDTLVGLIAANEEAQRFYRNMQGAIIRDEGIWIDC